MLCSCRLRGHTAPLVEPEALLSFLQDTCGNLLDKLDAEWCAIQPVAPAALG